MPTNTISASNAKSSVQEYELKIGVIHHASLKTTQLIEFLENEANQFLQNDLPQYIKGQEKFINVMQTINFQKSQIQDDLFEQYVGLMLIYSTGSQQSYQYFKQIIHQILQLQQSQLFLIVIEMDNTDKQTNIIGKQGQNYCKRNQNLQFVKLNLYNSQDLINIINKNLYQLIQNYYYPNEEDHHQKQFQLQQEKNQSPYQQYSRRQKSNQSNDNNNKKYILQYPSEKQNDQNPSTIRAYQLKSTQSLSPSKQKVQQMLNYASLLRKSRQKQIQNQQEQIDQSISNVQNVLNNINNRIKEKLQSGWFTAMSQSLCNNVEKNNQNYSKIKLTQEFIDYQPKKSKKAKSSSIVQSRFSDILSHSSKNFALNFNTLKFNQSTIKNPLTKIVLFLSKENVIQLEVYENSTYQELALIALRRLGLRQTQKNHQIMIKKIKTHIQLFTRQFQRAIKSHEEKRIQQRSYLKGKNMNNLSN